MEALWLLDAWLTTLGFDNEPFLSGGTTLQLKILGQKGLFNMVLEGNVFASF